MKWISLGLPPAVSQVHCYGRFLQTKISTTRHSQLSHLLKVRPLFSLSVSFINDCSVLLQESGEEEESLGLSTSPGTIMILPAIGQFKRRHKFVRSLSLLYNDLTNINLAVVIVPISTSDSESQEPRMIGDFDGSANEFWKLYRDEAKSHDDARINTLKEGMDSALIFVRSYSFQAPNMDLVMLMYGSTGWFIFCCSHCIRS